MDKNITDILVWFVQVWSIVQLAIFWLVCVKKRKNKAQDDTIQKSNYEDLKQLKSTKSSWDFFNFGV